MIEPFVSWSWVSECLPEVYFADVRWHLDGGGYEEYLSGHLPGAVFVDLDRDLSFVTTREEGRHPLPPVTRFADTLCRLGIDGTRPVVAYDSEGGVAAARLVWMLRVWGLSAAILDGGLCDVDIPLVTGACPTSTAQPVPRGCVDRGTHFSAAQREPDSLPRTPIQVINQSSSAHLETGWPVGQVADTTVVEDISRQTGGPSTVLIDARPRERYAGQDATDAKAGHIPTARSVPCREHLTASGHLRSRAQLRGNFAAAGIDSTSDVISYCGSGVTGCHNALVLEYLGYRPARLYPGSFSAWAARDLPVETGE